MDCEIKYVETTELTNIPYISFQLICATAMTSCTIRCSKKISVLKKNFSTVVVLHI